MGPTVRKTMVSEASPKPRRNHPIFDRGRNHRNHAETTVETARNHAATIAETAAETTETVPPYRGTVGFGFA
jgi:hypothetical protein